MLVPKQTEKFQLFYFSPGNSCNKRAKKREGEKRKQTCWCWRGGCDSPVPLWGSRVGTRVPPWTWPTPEGLGLPHHFFPVLLQAGYLVPLKSTCVIEKVGQCATVWLVVIKTGGCRRESVCGGKGDLFGKL